MAHSEHLHELRAAMPHEPAPQRHFCAIPARNYRIALTLWKIMIAIGSVGRGEEERGRE